MVWNSGLAANVRLLFFHLTQYSSMSAHRISEKHHCAKQLTSLFLPSFIWARPVLVLCNVSHSFSHAQITPTSRHLLLLATKSQK